MNTDIDKSIDFSYRILGLLWLLGAACLAYELLADDDKADCPIAAFHIDKC